MRDHDSWSVSIGRFGGLNLRLHMAFMLFAAMTLYVSWREGLASDDRGLVRVAALGLAILFASVLFHEIWHYSAAVRLGGGGERLVLGPLGGLAPLRLPRDPSAELRVHLAGPLANCLVCLVCIPLLLAQGPVEFAPLLHPLKPPLGVADSVLPLLVRLAFFINWVLLLANCMPAFPFDGAWVVRAILLLVWPRLSRRKAAVAVARFAKTAAIGLFVLACFLRAPLSGGFLPPWFVLAVLAIILLFSARNEESQPEEQEGKEELFGYDFSQGYASLEQSSAAAVSQRGPITRWIERRREAKRRRRREIEAEEELRVDEILTRLHERGMGSLSDRDRTLLERVSERYRNRLGPRA